MATDGGSNATYVLTPSLLNDSEDNPTDGARAGELSSRIFDDDTTDITNNAIAALNNNSRDMATPSSPLRCNNLFDSSVVDESTKTPRSPGATSRSADKTKRRKKRDKDSSSSLPRGRISSVTLADKDSSTSLPRGRILPVNVADFDTPQIKIQYRVRVRIR
jgi:hypothetical protein